MVTVYTLPNCVQCKATYRALDTKGIKYEVEDLSELPEKAEEFKALGHLQAPIVQTPDDLWHGFRPDLIAGLAA